ncbi:hypothetical protein KSP40_PGU021810 [Platanthera guangdongensis]|uniref:Uncharacterized protein n=1 Tax=Platanthera guangdongensis TaxID=2320717 RepID=A0ABR2LTN1_9ASPA
MEGCDSSDIVDFDPEIESTLLARRRAAAEMEGNRILLNDHRGELEPQGGQAAYEHDVIRPSPRTMRDYTTPIVGSVCGDLLDADVNADSSVIHSSPAGCRPSIPPLAFLHRPRLTAPPRHRSTLRLRVSESDSDG